MKRSRLATEAATHAIETQNDRVPIRESLSSEGRQLLKLVVEHVAKPNFKPGDPSSYLGYKECCVALGAVPADAEVPWGRLLQKHGLSDLNEWTINQGLPRVSGLIVSQSGDRQYWPGGDYFASNGRPDMDGDWWKEQAKKAAQMDWRPYL